MKIHFKCSCGRVLTVSAAKAGKRGKCSHCGQTLRVPQPSESCENPDRKVPPVHRALQSASPSKQTSSSGKRRIVLCSAVGGSVLLLVICVFLISRLFTSSEQNSVTGNSKLVDKVEDMGRASHIASNGGENSNRAGVHEQTVASGGNAPTSSDNHSDTPDAGPDRVPVQSNQHNGNVSREADTRKKPPVSFALPEAAQGMWKMDVDSTLDDLTNNGLEKREAALLAAGLLLLTLDISGHSMSSGEDSAEFDITSREGNTFTLKMKGSVTGFNEGDSVILESLPNNRLAITKPGARKIRFILEREN